MSLQANDLYSYDAVPYSSWPFAQSHPDRLATIATLFGLEPHPVAGARVLELGCAGGGNLIPMAEAFPESRFVGVDLSARELADGSALVEDLGLNNIELHHLDISDVGEQFGKFHYIIAHGVYSWVPAVVRDRILQVAEQNLADNGVAYISYNTYPGWRMRGMIRDMLLYHTEQFSEPHTQVMQARALLKFVAESLPAQGNPYGAYLKQELELFNRVRDDYLYHDHLATTNEPIYFHEFVRHAEGHGLQYLGDADFGTMVSLTLSEQVDATLQRISKDIVQIEQYMDFVRNRTFRQTLLCHAQHRLDRSLDPRHAAGLYFASRLKPDDSPDGAERSERVRFRAKDVKVQTADPLIQEALLTLSHVWPAWISFEALLKQALARSGPEATGDGEKTEAAALRLGEHLIRCYAFGVVEAHGVEPRFITSLSARPTVSPLARHQARSAAHVTTRRHAAATLDRLARHAATFLDGSRDEEDVLERLLELVEEGELEVRDDGDGESDRLVPAALLRRELRRSLQELARAALLVR